MLERRANQNMTRQCARFGCSAVAIATFTFESASCTVWLDTPLEGNARAGELCARHARSLMPPRGWKLEDRRGSDPVPSPPLTADGPGEPEALPSGQLAAGPAGPELEDELRGLLDAHSPLLARAFRSSGTV
ncbi:MAG: DUF3499 family protein [Acidimicrobiia bacterium]